MKIKTANFNFFKMGGLFLKLSFLTTLGVVFIIVSWLFTTQSALAAPAAGSLIRSVTNPAVYYVGYDGKKYVFIDQGTYGTWYRDFKQVKMLNQQTVDSLSLGGYVTARPGIRPIKIPDDPKVYAIEPSEILHWIPDEQTFKKLGYSFSKITIISPDSLRNYSLSFEARGLVEGSFVSDDPANKLYYIQDGKKRLVTDEVMRTNLYFPHHLLHPTDRQLILSLPDGLPLTNYELRVAGRPDYRYAKPPENQPLPPAQFIATGGILRILLNWQPPANQSLINYQLFRSASPISNLNDANVSNIANPGSTTLEYIDNNLQPRTTYYYAIRSQGQNNTYSQYIIAQATTQDSNQADNEPPLPPNFFNATSGQNQIGLNWTASPSTDVNSYLIYRSTSAINNNNTSGANLIATLNSATLSYTDNNLQANTTYYYAIRARDAAMNFSSILTAYATTLIQSNNNDTTPPLVPASLVAVGGQQQVGLSWPASLSSDVQNYLIYHSLAPINEVNIPGATLMATLPATSLNYTDTGLAISSTYYYALRARDAAMNLSNLVTAQATTLNNSDPTAPSSFNALGGQQLVHLNWAAPANASQVTSYLVYRSPMPVTNPNQPGILLTSTWPDITTYEYSTSYIDSGLQLNTDYYYSIKARFVNTLGALVTTTPVRLITTPASPAKDNHPRVYESLADITAMRQRLQSTSNDDFKKMLNFQWSKGGYSKTSNLKGPVVDYSSINSAQWFININANTSLAEAQAAFTQLNNIIVKGSLIALLTDDELIRQKAIHALMKLPQVMHDVTDTWTANHQYPDTQPRAIYIKDMMSLLSTGYDRLYPWLTALQRQEVAEAGKYITVKYKDFWVWYGFATSGSYTDFMYGETHIHDNNAIYLRSLLAFYSYNGSDQDMLPATRQYFNNAINDQLNVYRNYLNWIAQFYQDGSGGAPPYWGAYAWYETERCILTIEAITNTTGQSWYLQFPWLRNLVTFWAYYNLPNDFVIHFGDAGYNRRYNITQITNLAEEYNDSLAGWLANTRWRRWKDDLFYTYTEGGLHYNPNLQVQSPNQLNLPLDWYSQKAGLAIMRSGWSDDDVVVAIENPPTMKLQKLHQTAGSFSIYYKGAQVVKSGYYSVNQPDHWNYYYRNTISGNTITIYNPNEIFCNSHYQPGDADCLGVPSGGYLAINAGGQNYRRQTVSVNDFLQTDRQMGATTHLLASNYSYVRADLEPAYRRYLEPNYTTYDSKASQVLREFVFLKPQKTFVILDRVTSLNPNYTKRWLLHTETEPTVDDLINTAVPGHITEHNGSSVSVAASGQGRLFAKLLLPSSRSVLKIGGSGYEFFNNGGGGTQGQNYPPPDCEHPNKANCNGRGKWRIEVYPTQAQATDLFLNVLYIDDASVSSMPNTLLLVNNNQTIAAQTGNSVIVFSGNNQNQTQASYQANGATNHTFLNLIPNTNYRLTAAVPNSGLNLQTIGFSSDNQGTAQISFSAGDSSDLRNYQLNQR